MKTVLVDFRLTEVFWDIISEKLKEINFSPLLSYVKKKVKELKNNVRKSNYLTKLKNKFYILHLKPNLKISNKLFL